jgi:AraC-like DNA-binding protein
LTVDVISVDDGPAFVMGPPTEARHIPLPAGTTNKGVRLRAGAAQRLLDASPAELLNAIVPLSELLRTRSARGIAAAPDDVHAHVPQLLRQSATDEDPTVRSAIAWLARNWRSSVDDLSKHANSSNRELRRRFMAAIGMGPKLVQRMVRVQAALHLMQARKGRLSLSDLAFECGFADQAHMTRELARFTDYTPTHLRRLAHPPAAG